jgi:DNA-binding MarR family transcriptional regulator
VISRLEGRGWVRRRSGTKGRTTYAELTNTGYLKLMAAGQIHLREVRRLVFDVLTPEEVKALKRVTSLINAGLLSETNLGALARRTREPATGQSS